jgi:hypothetical protein
MGTESQSGRPARRMPVIGGVVLAIMLVACLGSLP